VCWNAKCLEELKEILSGYEIPPTPKSFEELVKYIRPGITAKARKEKISSIFKV
jgi:hypothetical protein